jgi:hypothetical protein
MLIAGSKTGKVNGNRTEGRLATLGVKKSSHTKFWQSHCATRKSLWNQHLHSRREARWQAGDGLVLALSMGNGGSLGMISSTKHAVALAFFIALLFVAVMNRDIVPEQGTLALLGTGLVGLATIVRRNLSNPADSTKE